MVVDSDDAPQKVAQVVKEQLETTLPGLTINLVVEPMLLSAREKSYNCGTRKIIVREGSPLYEKDGRNQDAVSLYGHC